MHEFTIDATIHVASSRNIFVFAKIPKVDQLKIKNQSAIFFVNFMKAQNLYNFAVGLVIRSINFLLSTIG